MFLSANPYRATDARIQVYNSLGSGKQPLEPLDPGMISPAVKVYVCGLTPQDHSHVGHGLMSMRFDMIRRYMLYRRLDVTFVQNVTDIDDKIIDRSMKTGEDPITITRRFTDEFYGCLDRLHVLPVDKLPRVTEFVPQIISFVQGLIERGMAYATDEGNVYFDVRKKEDYGKLSNQNIGMLFESVRKELDKQKHSPLDFALWKRDESTALSQPSPWGIGRPGWHIECSVMIHETLGDRIDIHGGGLDLKFPHHENEIAQSEAYTGMTLANVWMHTGLLNINGQKMSKSLHNFITLVDGIERYGAAPLRFVIARHHYRSAIDLTDKLFRDNLNSLIEFHRFFDRFIDNEEIAKIPEKLPDQVSLFIQAFEGAMNNDFNSPEALVVLEHARAKTIEGVDKGEMSAEDALTAALVIRELGHILGLFFDLTAAVEDDGLRFAGTLRASDVMTRAAISGLIEERREVRAQKNYARSDEIRKELADAGIELLDSKAGTTWRFA